MSVSLTIQFFDKWGGGPTMPAGLTCDLWPTADFVNNPVSGGPAPTWSAASSTTTNSSGEATFSVASAAAYWVRLVDQYGKNWWSYISAAWWGTTQYITLVRQGYPQGQIAQPNTI